MANETTVEMLRRNQIFGDGDEFDDPSSIYAGGNRPQRADNGKEVHIIALFTYLVRINVLQAMYDRK